MFTYKINRDQWLTLLAPEPRASNETGRFGINQRAVVQPWNSLAGVDWGVLTWLDEFTEEKSLKVCESRSICTGSGNPRAANDLCLGGIAGFVCLPRDPLLAPVRDGYLVGPDVAVLDVLQPPEIAHKLSPLCHPAVFMFIKGKEENLNKCKTWNRSRLLCGVFYFEIKYFKYFQS